MISKSFAIVFVLLIIGLTICRSHSEFRRIDNAAKQNDDDTDSEADNEIISTKHVDIVEPIHGFSQSNEHGMRSKRTSDGANGNLTENLNENTTSTTPDTASSTVSSSTANIPTTTATANDTSDDSLFEIYFGEFLKKNPDVLVLRSPKNFDNRNKTWNLSVTGGQNVEVLIHLLDINPFSNYMSIKAVHGDANSFITIVGPISPKNVQKIIVMDTQDIVVSYQFANSQSSKYDGFVLTYKSIGEPIQNETNNANVTIPLQEYSHIKILLKVSKVKQNNETLAQLRLLFAQSANKFITAEKLPIEQCKLENVKFVDVLHCPSTWPNSENCIQIELAIPLKIVANASVSNVKSTALSTGSGEDLDSEKIEYELTFEHLLQMWIRYGRPHFAQNEFDEFPPPNTKSFLVLWTSISLVVLLVFLLVLYGILKIDFLKDYRRMRWKMSDDQSQMCKQSEIDISMFPSPHQTVPTLFPNDLTAYSSAPNASASLPFEYVNQPISFSQSDFKRRGSLEESLKLDNDVSEQREAGVVPFQSEIIDFNEPHGEDEITFSRAATDSSRGQIKYRMGGKNDSIS